MLYMLCSINVQCMHGVVQVVRALDTMATSDLTNGMRVGESQMFSPTARSAEIRLFQRMAFGNMSTGFFDHDTQ